MNNIALDFVNNIECQIIDLDRLVLSFKFLSEHFENKVQEDYSYLIKHDAELYHELCSYYTLFMILCKTFEKLHNDCQNEIDLYYKKLC